VQHYALAEVRRRRAVEAALTSTLRAWSYEEVLLPLLDYQEVFEQGAGHGAGSRMYRLIDPEGHVLAVRPDLTPLVAKLAATSLRDAPLPIRLYYAGDVVRPEAPKALGQGEFHQVGFEQIGGERGAADLEVAVVALEALAWAGLRAPRMTLAHSALLPALCERASLPPEAAARAHERVSRRDAAGLARLLDEAGAGAALRQAFGYLLEGGASEAACALLGKQGGPAAQQALRELRERHRDLESLGYAGRVEIDLADVGGFDYYTGVCFRVYAEGVGFPIGGGGRYDRLLVRFGADRPAIGFSFGLDRVLRALEASGGGPSAGDEEARAVRAASGGRLKAIREALKRRGRGERVRLC
jgi:ATP phosphoribosyltransferase regulatory subunit